MKNKSVIRKENKAGEFTTVKYKILRDKSLNSNAKILMIEILSDTDRFDFSETLFMNRMDVGAKGYRSALAKLVASGYIRTKKIGNSNLNYYTISEYGNLNNTDITNEEQVEELIIQPEIETTVVPTLVELTKDECDNLGVYMSIYKNFLTDDIVSKFSTMIHNDMDFYLIKSEIDKLINKEKKSFFNKIANEIKVSSSNQDTKNEAIKLLKIEVFDKNTQLDCNRARTRANEIINRRRPQDQESLAADRADGI
jgi:hypothetical protein